MHRRQSGTLLQVIATTTMDISSMSVAAATIGLRRLTATVATARAAWSSSTTKATSIRRAAPVARTVSLSVVSKNNI